MKTLIIILILLLFIPVQAQRTELQYLWGYFYQPSIKTVDYWNINWHDGINDSINIYKNDTSRVKIRNESGQWVNYAPMYELLDTTIVRIKITHPYNYNIAFIFNIISRNNNNLSSVPSELTIVFFMLSDINKTIDPNLNYGYLYGDNIIDGLDLIELGKHWQQTGMTYEDMQDINNDGIINELDLSQLFQDWGKTWIP